MQCTSSFNKNSPLLTFNICNYSRLLLNSVTLFSTSTRFGIFHRAWLVRRCWIASKTSTWNKQFKRQKRNLDDQTNLNKEGVFQRWNVFFVRYYLQSNLTGFFWLGLCRKYKEETEGFQRRLNMSLHSFWSLPIPTDCKLKFYFYTRTWNCGMQSPHISEHRNLWITTITFPSCN